MSFATTNPEGPSALTRLGRAWLLTAVIDGLFSSFLAAVIYGSTVGRLWRGVASVPLGSEALSGGTGYALIGVMLHVAVALTWSSVFLLGAMRMGWIRKLLASRYGVVKAASLYGPFIWLVMSLVVIPVLAQRPPAITVRWWVQFFGHIPFVALPMIWMLTRGTPRPEL